jgi:hypothetical protein
LVEIPFDRVWKELLENAPVRFVECVENALRGHDPSLHETQVAEIVDEEQDTLRRRFDERLEDYKSRRLISPLRWSGFDSERVVNTRLALKHLEAYVHYVRNDITWSEFEILCKNILERVGLSRVARTRAAKDAGIDLIGIREARSGLVQGTIVQIDFLVEPIVWVFCQCKHSAEAAIGVNAIRDFVGSVEIFMRSSESERDVGIGTPYDFAELAPFAPRMLVLLTSSYWTKDAWKLSRTNGVHLVDGEGLAQALILEGVGIDMDNVGNPPHLEDVRVLTLEY